mgnify:CR=1 FL=1|jgi:hypothetical protein
MFFFDEIEQSCIPIAYAKKDGDTVYIDEFISPLNSINFKLPIVGSPIIVKFTEELIGTDMNILSAFSMFSGDAGDTFRSIPIGDLGEFKQRKDRTRYELEYKS